MVPAEKQEFLSVHQTFNPTVFLPLFIPLLLLPLPLIGLTSLPQSQVANRFLVYFPLTHGTCSSGKGGENILLISETSAAESVSTGEELRILIKLATHRAREIVF